MHMGMGSGADGSTRWEAASGQEEEVTRMHAKEVERRRAETTIAERRQRPRNLRTSVTCAAKKWRARFE
jgi:hypothetical protein